MLRQKPSRSNLESHQSQNLSNDLETLGVNINIQKELNQIEELILASPRLFFTGRTLINEEKLLDKLDLVRLNLPDAFQAALDIIHRKEQIMLEGETYAEEVIASAQKRAEQILDEMDLVKRAEQEANQIRQQVQQECENLKQTTLAEIEQIRRQAQQELDEIQRTIISESEEIQNGADEYADEVLTNIETQLTDMLRVIRNGRQQIHQHPPTRDRFDSLS